MKWIQQLFQYQSWLLILYRFYHYFIHEFGYLAFLNNNIAHYIVSKLLTFYRNYKLLKYPSLLQQCTPNYQMGCKRILLSNNWYDCIINKKLTLITDKIFKISSNGIWVTLSKEEEEIKSEEVKSSVTEATTTSKKKTKNIIMILILLYMLLVLNQHNFYII